MAQNSRNGYRERGAPLYALFTASKSLIGTISNSPESCRLLSQGLVFLHKHRIAHRVSRLPRFYTLVLRRAILQDITEVNMMVNCYKYNKFDDSFGDDLRRHRKSNNIYYALMDYDQSIMLPEDTDIRTCVRPSSEARHGDGTYKLWNGGFGEPTYNPFAFDVGMLGNVFRAHLCVRGSNRVPILITYRFSWIYIGNRTEGTGMCSAVRQDDDTRRVSTMDC